MSQQIVGLVNMGEEVEWVIDEYLPAVLPDHCRATYYLLPTSDIHIAGWVMYLQVLEADTADH